MIGRNDQTLALLRVLRIHLTRRRGEVLRRFGFSVEEHFEEPAHERTPEPHSWIAVGKNDGADAVNRQEDHVAVVAREIAAMMHDVRSEEHTSELQSPCNLVCRL